MKKLVLLVLAVVAIVALCWGGAVAIDKHYKNHQNKVQTSNSAKAASVQKAEQLRQAKATAQAEAQTAALKGLYNKEVAECQKGLIAYGKLTTFAKTQILAPVCGQAL